MCHSKQCSIEMTPYFLDFSLEGMKMNHDFLRSQRGRMAVYKYFQRRIMNNRILDEEKTFTAFHCTHI